LLFVAIAGNESAYGTSHVAQLYNNAFGIMQAVRGANGKVTYAPRRFLDIGGGIPAVGSIVARQIAKGNDTVNLLYSGQKGAYCVDTPTVPCAPGAINVSSILTNLGGNPNDLE